MPVIVSMSGRLHSEFVRLLFSQAHRETDHFFASSGVQLAQTNTGLFHFRRTAFSSQIRLKVVLYGQRLRQDHWHSHPSHSQTSHLLTSSLSSVVVWFIVIQKNLWSKLLGYTTYYAISLIRTAGSVVRESFFFSGATLWSPPSRCVTKCM